MRTRREAMLQIEFRAIVDLRPLKRNARTHSKKQIREIAESIRRFGFTNPVLISDDDQIVAGHGRVEAAKLLAITQVPVVRLSHLSEAERRAYVLADNRLALEAGWDNEILAIEFQGLQDLGIDLSVTGFSMPEIDIIFQEAVARSEDAAAAAALEDVIPDQPIDPATRTGDLWQLGPHRLLCGDAREFRDFERLMDGNKAGLIVADPPYNVRLDGNVCGSGRIRHREFAMAVHC